MFPSKACAKSFSGLWTSECSAGKATRNLRSVDDVELRDIFTFSRLVRATRPKQLHNCR